MRKLPLATQRRWHRADAWARRMRSEAACRGAGCSACCRLDVVAEEQEARVLWDHLGADARAAVTAVDLGPLWRALEDGEGAARALAGPCPVLIDGRCSAYAFRPAICRSYLVRSDPAHCSTPADGQVSQIQPDRELIGILPERGADFLVAHLSRFAAETGQPALQPTTRTEPLTRAEDLPTRPRLSGRTPGGDPQT